MKTWLKGGLIGAGAGAILSILNFYFTFGCAISNMSPTANITKLGLSLCNFTDKLSSVIFPGLLLVKHLLRIYGFIVYPIIEFFIVGILIGLIISKIKSKQEIK